VDRFEDGMVGVFLLGVILGFIFGALLATVVFAALRPVEPPPPPPSREPIPRKRPANCTEFYRRPRNVA
jgi:hypothetical protein